MLLKSNNHGVDGEGHGPKTFMRSLDRDVQADFNLLVTKLREKYLKEKENFKMRFFDTLANLEQLEGE
jgi:hypothetical protein